MSRSIALLLLVCQLSTILALPAGTMTFFESPSCPAGWSLVQTTQGRLIVSVTNFELAGVTVNTPLGDQEDRTHTHTYTTTANFPEHEVAAIGCCNNQGAGHGEYDVQGAMTAEASSYPFAQLLLCRLDVDDGNPASYGSIAYFDAEASGCPPLWSPLDEAAGRILVPGYNQTSLTVSSAPPLQSGEDRLHSHPYLTSFDTIEVSYAGVSGCCNHGPSNSGPVYLEGETSSDSTGLPYIQLLTCVSENTTFDSGFPAGALVYNTIMCPPGWDLAVELSGRMLVGLPAGAQPAQFGGPALKPDSVSTPQHNHPFSGNVNTNSVGVGLASGCCAGGYAANHNYAYTGTSNSTAFELPYAMVPLCRKLDAPVQVM